MSRIVFDLAIIMSKGRHLGFRPPSWIPMSLFLLSMNSMTTQAYKMIYWTTISLANGQNNVELSNDCVKRPPF
jgi:hypothetical protein